MHNMLKGCLRYMAFLCWLLQIAISAGVAMNEILLWKLIAGGKIIRDDKIYVDRSTRGNN